MTLLTKKNLFSRTGAWTTKDAHVTKDAQTTAGARTTKDARVTKGGAAQSCAASPVRRTRIAAALSVVIAGSLVIGLCGGSFSPLEAAAVVGGEGNTAGANDSATGGAKAVDAVNATPKEEVVYARLSAAGSVNDVYVVNVLKPDKPGSVTDYGAYSAVQNLTDASGIERKGTANTVDVKGESASYQGTMVMKALPWSVSITYKLDGMRIEPAELGGASGKLEIVIETKRDPASDQAFFDNYLLQVTVPFAAETATEVATADGQIALAGSNTQVTFTGLPGKDGSFKVEAQVTDFAMSGITFAAVPFSMGIEPPDTEGLVSGFRQLGDGVGALKAGADGLAGGASTLASGVGQVAGGVSSLAGGARELSGGAGQLSGGAQQLADGAKSVAAGAAGLAAGIGAYQSQLYAQAQATRGQIVDPSGLEAQYQQALQTYIGGYAQAYHGAKESGLDDGAAHAAAAAATADLATAMQSALANFMAATGGNAGLTGAADALDGAADGLDAPDPQTGTSLTGAASQLAGGTSGIASGAGELAGGVSGLATGAGDLASGANEAASGAGQLSNGASQLSSGAQQLAAGTGELYTEVQAIPEKVQQEIDTMMADYDKSDFKPVSFTSKQNTNVSLVQFVMSTDAIEAPIAEEPMSEEPEQSIWDRFLALFGW